ncbi:general transcription factor II-I repeat domain-containing protein 2A [Trichonephila clavipes]|nr:general transcription factor II-I repeat domain-containing protein 2A [Trichonephila clavipes]
MPGYSFLIPRAVVGKVRLQSRKWLFGSAPQITWLPKKAKKTEDENREFKAEWTENFAFIQNLNGLPTCFICKEKFAHNKKSNLERHFTRKQASFSTKYATGDARKKSVEELQKSRESSTSVCVNIPAILIWILRTKQIFCKELELPFSAKTIKDRTIKMCSSITTQYIEDLKLVSALSIAVDESCDINDTAQVSLFPVRTKTHPQGECDNAIYGLQTLNRVPFRSRDETCRLIVRTTNGVGLQGGKPDADMLHAPVTGDWGGKMTNR